jgi:hypothetical protein
VIFTVRTAQQRSIYRELGAAISATRQATLRGASVAITSDNRQWWTVRHESHRWFLEHEWTIASLFDTTDTPTPAWHQRALDLLARLDESASTTNQPTLTMEVSAS